MKTAIDVLDEVRGRVDSYHRAVAGIKALDRPSDNEPFLRVQKEDVYTIDRMERALRYSLMVHKREVSKYESGARGQQLREDPPSIKRSKIAIQQITAILNGTDKLEEK